MGGENCLHSAGTYIWWGNIFYNSELISFRSDDFVLCKKDLNSQSNGPSSNFCLQVFEIYFQNNTHRHSTESKEGYQATPSPNDPTRHEARHFRRHKSPD